MTDTKTCQIADVTVGAGKLALIAGPCLAESLDMCLAVAEHLAGVCDKLDIGLIFKASYDKANRTSVASPRGPGLELGLAWLGKVREQLGVAVLSDVHDIAQASRAGSVLDCLQIPAFLCRQTDLLVAAGETGRAVNVKKGQFVAPDMMRFAVEKVRSTGAKNVMLTERGTIFGDELLAEAALVPLAAAQLLGCLLLPTGIDSGHQTAQDKGRKQSGSDVEFVGGRVGEKEPSKAARGIEEHAVHCGVDDPEGQAH